MVKIDVGCDDGLGSWTKSARSESLKTHMRITENLCDESRAAKWFSSELAVGDIRCLLVTP